MFEPPIFMNLLLWGTTVDKGMFPEMETIKRLGFNGVEIPIFQTDPSHWESWPSFLDDMNLGRVAVTIHGPEYSLIHPVESKRKEAIDQLKRTIDTAQFLGARILAGPYHSSLGVFTGEAPTENELACACNNLIDLSFYAQERGITLALEYLNRFESYLVSSSAELHSLVKQVNHSACRVMLDTFHANIEEKSLETAIRTLKDHLVHVQLSENDRGTLGHGHIPLKGVLETLKEINYAGVLSIEAFSQKLKAANIWRKMFLSEKQLMEDSLTHIQDLLNEINGKEN